MSKISIVVPVYFNEDTLELLYEDMKNNQVSDEAKCFNQNPSNEKRRLNRFT